MNMSRCDCCDALVDADRDIDFLCARGGESLCEGCRDDDGILPMEWEPVSADDAARMAMPPAPPRSK